jgi:hypothetical protein
VLVVVIVVVGAAIMGAPEPPAPPPVALPALTLRLPLTIEAIDPFAPPPRPATIGSIELRPSAAPGTESVQICGGEWVTVETDAQGEQRVNTETESARATRSRTLARMRESPSEYDRAIGAWLGASPYLEAARAAASAAGCQDDTCLIAHAFESVSPADDELARAAAATSDPRLYALAYPACWNKRTKGNCALLSPQQWARIDPGNATPWLYALQAATEANDASARDEALYRIATSEREATRYFEVADRIIAAAPTDDGALMGTTRLAIEALGRVGTQPTFHIALIKRCRVMAEADPNTWQLCAAAAEHLAEHSDTALGRTIGIAMGRNLGMPPERFDRAQGEIVDAQRPNAQGPFADAHVFSDCGAFRRDLAALRLRASMGEIEAMRASLGASAASPEELLRLGRERRLQREAAMRAPAASAATEASSAAQTASR